MLRLYAALSVFGLLALGLVIGLNLGSPADSGTMTHARSGEPLTLEAVQKDVVWHRDTARKLRELD
jgi:hypothetical protein